VAARRGRLLVVLALQRLVVVVHLLRLLLAPQRSPFLLVVAALLNSVDLNQLRVVLPRRRLHRNRLLFLLPLLPLLPLLLLLLLLPLLQDEVLLLVHNLALP
jgi:hypothetical protein